jgi:tetratricopeptide (TPR) repeat protein
VHLNFDGNYLLARAWAGKVELFLPAGITNQAATDWASQETCERVLGLTDWNRYDVLQKALGRVLEAPFTNQINNAARLSHMTRQLAEVKDRLHPRAIMDARFTCEEAVKQRPEDHWLRQKFAEFLEDVGDLAQAVKEWEKVRDLLPHHHLAWFQAGRLLAAQGKWADAQPLLVQAVTLRPDLSEGWFELGKMHVAQGNLSLALDEFERARALVPENYHVYYQMGKALSKSQRSYAAIDNFREAVRLGPKNYWEAHYALGEELAFAGKDAEARAEFETVINLKPNVAMAHLNLGVALVKQGQMETAAEQFAETLRLDPGNKLAQDALAKIIARQLPAQ